MPLATNQLRRCFAQAVIVARAAAGDAPTDAKLDVDETRATAHRHLVFHCDQIPVAVSWCVGERMATAWAVGEMRADTPACFDCGTGCPRSGRKANRKTPLATWVIERSRRSVSTSCAWKATLAH